jgi:hypothetical protein
MQVTRVEAWGLILLITGLQAKMKAAQEKFVASYQPTGDSSCREKEVDAKFPKDFVVELTSEDSPLTACALCHDSASTSPICFLILVQVFLLH